MSAPIDNLLVAFDIDERERLNEWAAEVGIPAGQLVRRLVLRYVNPLRTRDAIDDRIGHTLLARAANPVTSRTTRSKSFATRCATSASTPTTPRSHGMGDSRTRGLRRREARGRQLVRTIASRR